MSRVHFPRPEPARRAPLPALRQELAAAFEVLGDPVQRELYDEQREERPSERTLGDFIVFVEAGESERVSPRHAKAVKGGSLGGPLA